MARLTIAEPAPEHAFRRGTIAYTFDAPHNGQPTVSIWYGKAKRPKRYRFTSPERRDQWLQSQFEADDAEQKRKAKRLAELDQLKAAMLDKIQVGTILHYSWGYEQTNCDFYQVIRRKNSTVWIREIESVSVPGSDHGGMSDRRRPARDKFVEGAPVLQKRIDAYGVKFAHGSADPVESDEQQHFCSWYG